MSQKKLIKRWKKKAGKLLSKIKISSCIIILLSSGFLAFGLYHVHSLSGVTEGGVLGMTLLLEYWFGISPAVSGFVMNLFCYAAGWRLLGKKFLFYSFLASTGFSMSYKIWEQFEPLWPNLADMPLLAAVIGAVFVGVGVGFCVRAGGAPTGDDAIAMTISRATSLDIQWPYLACDLVVLALSLSYIPVRKIAYSLLTVTASGQIIGMIQRLRLPDGRKKSEPEQQAYSCRL